MNRLQSEVARKRIIHVVCDSDAVNNKISAICDQKIESFGKDLRIEALTKVMQGVKFWLPFGVSTVIGFVGIITIVVG